VLVRLLATPEPFGVSGKPDATYSLHDG